MGAALLNNSAAADNTLTAFRLAGINDEALAEQLQVEGKAAFNKSWDELLRRISEKVGALNVHA